MQKHLSRILPAVWLALFICGATQADESETHRLPLPDNLQYFYPAAVAHGAEAIWNNPAGLATLRYTSVQGMAEYYAGDYARTWGMAAQRDGVGLTYRYIDNPGGPGFKEWLGAAGIPLGSKLFVGSSYRRFSAGPSPYDGLHQWAIGLTGRSRGKFSWAAVFSNLNRVTVNGERTETEQRYSLAYRPTRDNLTLAVDMFLSTKTRLSNADFVYYAEYRPIPGLYIDGWFNSDRDFQVGVRANLLEYFVGSKAAFDKKGHNGRTVVYAGATDQRQPSLLPWGSRRLVAGVAGHPSENPPQPVFGYKATPFYKVLTGIYRAADDPTISEMQLNLSGLRLGFGQAQELRDGITYFRSRGKEVTSYLTAPNNVSYYVASATDRILIPPVSQLKLVGLRAELTFYAATLEKLGVKIELLRIGDHKTAPERYTRSAASEENRQQVNMLLDGIYSQMVGDIAHGRGITEDSVRKIIDNGPFTSQAALQAGLVDGLVYYDDLHEKTFHSNAEISLRRYLADTLFNDSWEELPVLALIVAEGEITSDDGDISPLGQAGDVTPGLMKRAFRRATADRDVAGAILRINSPGGSALAGEDVHHEGMKLAAKKPLVVSMANVAASGGYYIAMPGAHIFANRGTVTGSIGIYGGKADLSGLYEKLHVGKELYTRGRFAGMMSNTRPFTPEESEKYLDQLGAFYSHFLELVSANRGLPEDSIDALGRGRVWTGDQAVTNGLVDELGGLRQTIDYLATRLDLKDYRLRIYPEKRPWFIWPGRSLFGLLGALFHANKENSSDGIRSLFPEEYLLTRMPYDIEFE